MWRGLAPRMRLGGRTGIAMEAVSYDAAVSMKNVQVVVLMVEPALFW